MSRDMFRWLYYVPCSCRGGGSQLTVTFRLEAISWVYNLHNSLVVQILLRVITVIRWLHLWRVRR
jgi:hypothetical protein